MTYITCIILFLGERHEALRSYKFDLKVIEKRESTPIVF